MALEKAETSYMYAALVRVWPGGGWAFNVRLGLAIWDIDYTQQMRDASVTDPVSTESGWAVGYCPGNFAGSRCQLWLDLDAGNQTVAGGPSGEVCVHKA